MFLADTDEQRALRKELREYFADLLPDDVRRRLGQPGEGSTELPDLVRTMGGDGWLGIGWPKEYGGQGRGVLDQFIFFDEVQRAGAPFPFVTLNTVGPTLMTYGSEEQKRDFLPGHPQRRDQLRDRVHRARGRHRPRVAAHEGRARRRRVGDQRQQGVHQRREPGRLHLARVPHRPGGQEAQGHLDDHRPDRVAGVQDDARS